MNRQPTIRGRGRTVGADRGPSCRRCQPLRSWTDPSALRVQSTSRSINRTVMLLKTWNCTDERSALFVATAVAAVARQLPRHPHSVYHLTNSSSSLQAHPNSCASRLHPGSAIDTVPYRQKYTQQVGCPPRAAVVATKSALCGTTLLLQRHLRPLAVSITATTTCVLRRSSRRRRTKTNIASVCQPPLRLRSPQHNHNHKDDRIRLSLCPTRLVTSTANEHTTSTLAQPPRPGQMT